MSKIRVLEDQYKTQGQSVATVVLEADSRDDFEGLEAKKLAMEFARSRNFPAYGISNFPAIYPVDASGQTTDAIFRGLDKVVAWRCDIDISSGRLAW